MIVHIDSSIVYAIIEICPKHTKFGNDSTGIYAGSTIANLCTDWYNNYVPQELKSTGIFVNVNTLGVNSPCFIPTREQFDGEFSFFINDYSRQTNYTEYWTSTADASRGVWYTVKKAAAAATAARRMRMGSVPA